MSHPEEGAGPGVRATRYGPGVGRGWHFYNVARGITGSQTIQDTSLALVLPKGNRVRWAVFFPSGTCTVTTVRHVYIPGKTKDDAPLFDEIIAETSVNLTASDFVEMDVHGDYVGVFITNVAALAGSDSITVLYKAIP